MELAPYLSGIFALGGTLAGGLIAFFMHQRTQRAENIRHARKLALEVALTEWKRHEEWLNRQEAAGMKVRYGPPTTYIVSYMVLMAGILRHIDRDSSPEEFAEFLKSHDASFSRLLSSLTASP